MTQEHFANLRVAITGGTSGLGLALVNQLHRRGARVAFIARGPERIQHVAHDHPGTFGIAGDVSSKDDIYPIALQILGSLGGLDVLINNASDSGLCAGPPRRYRMRGFREGAGDESNRTVSLDESVARRAGGIRPREPGGVVLNVSSDAAMNAYPTWGAYGASKAALRHLTQIWEAELSAEGIHFLSVDPSDMDTPLHALAVPDADPATLKQPETAARELLDAIVERLAALSGR